jgi:hypothetical protein
MMLREYTITCYVLFVCGSAFLGSYGLVHGMRNHVYSAKHRDDMGRLS